MKKDQGSRKVAGAVFGFLFLLLGVLAWSWGGGVGARASVGEVGSYPGVGRVGAEEGRLAARLRRAPPGRLWIGRYEAWCGAARPGAEPGRVAPAALSLAGELQWARVLGRRAPPSLEQAAGYFREALGEQMMVDGPQRYRFERRTGFSWGTSWRRALLVGMEQGLSLEWWASDDFGVSELREFFEAPFFELSESLLLHTWLSEGGWHEAFFQGYSLRMGVLCHDDYVYVWMRWLDAPPFAG